MKTPNNSNSLVDVLETVLDKGVVIAGDIKINLADVELLTIKIRLLIASVDKAKEIGMDWWENDPHYSSKASKLQEENDYLKGQLEDLEKKVQQISSREESKT
ncbi:MULTISPECIES: gas vesicle protein [Alteribacter]|uniref:Gas vesicle protein n=1 Tax=Alteribacter keqinensis TaxID=2483800 RepID=A0A3M7TS76_9BACI|nr:MULTISPECIES: gas vesicle protein [Alteribacter]MBM7095655.1 gas vesicle protein [Alteribacter salitolerans]RNA68069.1 gas vesicle protein [Alteribacter keqinensis]